MLMYPTNKWSSVIIAVRANYVGIENDINILAEKFTGENKFNTVIVTVAKIGVVAKMRLVNKTHVAADTAQIALGIIKRNYINTIVVEKGSLDYRLGLLFNFGGVPNF